MSVRVAVVQATPVVLDAEATRREGLRPDRRGRRQRRPDHRPARGVRRRSTPARAGPTAARPSAARAPRCTGACGPPPWTSPGRSSSGSARPPGAPAPGWPSASTSATRPARGRSGTPWSGSRRTGRLAGKHRKLMPTLHERVFWGMGPGDDLAVHETEHGRLGGLICWENFMPEARQALHRQGVDFYLAPTADDRDVWVAAMRAFAFEAGAFVLSPVQYLPKTAFPADFPLADEIAAGPDELPPGRQPDRRPLGQPAGGAGVGARGDPLRRLRSGGDHRRPAGVRHGRPLPPARRRADLALARGGSSPARRSERPRRASQRGSVSSATQPQSTSLRFGAAGRAEAGAVLAAEDQSPGPPRRSRRAPSRPGRGGSSSTYAESRSSSKGASGRAAVGRELLALDAPARTRASSRQRQQGPTSVDLGRAGRGGRPTASGTTRSSTSGSAGSTR